MLQALEDVRQDIRRQEDSLRWVGLQLYGVHKEWGCLLAGGAESEACWHAAPPTGDAGGADARLACLPHCRASRALPSLQASAS